MRQWIILALLFLVAPFASATTRTAATCSAKDVQAQIKHSTDGDTVILPLNSSCTWTTTVTVTKGITLNLNGSTITMQNISPYGSLSITADTVASAFLTNGKIIGGTSPGVGPAAIQTATSLSPLTKAFRIYNLTLDDGSPTTGTATIIRNTGIGPGLIDSNTISTHVCNDETIQNWGSGTPLDGTTWTTDVIPGSLNALYIESNTYNHVYVLTSNSCVTSMVSNYYGARVVIRYNQLNLGYYIDAHMGNSTTGTGARWWEVYENTFALPGTQPGQPFHQGSYANFRGGSGLFYNNHSTGTPYQNVPPGWSFGQLGGSSDQQTRPWPLNWQIGRGINQTFSPPYAWGNDFLTTGGGTSFPSYVQVGPTLTSSTCIANATTGHLANFCDGINVGPGAQPTLIRCESAADVSTGCPVTYTYVPAPFPHPLRAAAGSGAPITLTNAPDLSKR
jgi:hypothetical protein